jgi:hypothetical protein
LGGIKNNVTIPISGKKTRGVGLLHTAFGGKKELTAAAKAETGFGAELSLRTLVRSSAVSWWSATSGRERQNLFEKMVWLQQQILTLPPVAIRIQLLVHC